MVLHGFHHPVMVGDRVLDVLRRVFLVVVVHGVGAVLVVMDG
jgi:hypothetical protein